IYQRVSPGAYTTWFRGTEGLDLRDGRLVVGVSNTFACAHLRQRFADTAALAVTEITGYNLAISFVVGELPQAEQAAPAQPPSEPAHEVTHPLPLRRARAQRARTRGQLAAQTTPLLTPRPAPASPPRAAQPPLVGMIPTAPAAQLHPLPQI